MEALKCAQDSWSESLISEEDLCDAVALVGPERHRVPFHRAPVGIVSKPLRAALYGDFKEGHTRELVLKDVTLEAFDVMIRCAYRLDLKLNPGRALQAMKAAKLYMIESLEQYCLEYLRAVESWECGQLLQILTECLIESIDLPEELRHIYFSHILSNSSAILQSPFFLEAHGSIIASLIKLDEFNVNEETLWDRLVQWSSHAVENPELLGPFASVTPRLAWKHAKSDKDDSKSGGPHQAAQQEAILYAMLRDIRFTSITKDFFVDKVRKYMNREESEAIIDFFLLGRKSPVMPASIWNQRVGLEPALTTKKIEGLVAHVPLRYAFQMEILLEEPQFLTCVDIMFEGFLEQAKLAKIHVVAEGEVFDKPTFAPCAQGQAPMPIMHFDLGSHCSNCKRMFLVLCSLPRPILQVHIYAKVLSPLESAKGMIEQLSKDVFDSCAP